MGDAHIHYFLGFEVIQGLSLKKDLSFLGADKPRYGLVVGGFPGAVGADERDDSPFLYLKGYIPQGMDISIRNG
jgi:hypothetical protein